MKNFIPGVYNLGCVNGISKANLAMKVIESLSIETEMLEVAEFSEVVDGKARRPLDMRMNVQKFQNAYEVSLPDITEVSNILIDHYKGGLNFD